jgi:hypothetical protein
MQTPRTELQREHHHYILTVDVINFARSRCIAATVCFIKVPRLCSFSFKPMLSESIFHERVPK